MTPEPPRPPDGLNFFVPWGFLEYAISGIAAMGAAVAGWVWSLGGRVRVAQAELRVVSRELARMEERFATMEERLMEAERAREALKVELLDRINDLPSRVFIESQMQQLTGRIDGLIDAKIYNTRRN